MQINTNMTSRTNYQVTNNNLKENDKTPSEQVFLGSTEKDETLIMGEQLKKMKHSDGMTSESKFLMIGEGTIYMAGGGLAGLLLFGALGATSGLGALAAIAGGCLVGGIGGFIHSHMKPFSTSALTDGWE